MSVSVKCPSWSGVMNSIIFNRSAQLNLSGPHEALTVASDGGRVVRRDLHTVVIQDVRAVHEAEVGAADEHVEVDAAAVGEDVAKDLLEICA